MEQIYAFYAITDEYPAPFLSGQSGWKHFLELQFYLKRIWAKIEPDLTPSKSICIYIDLLPELTDNTDYIYLQVSWIQAR